MLITAVIMTMAMLADLRIANLIRMQHYENRTRFLICIEIKF